MENRDSSTSLYSTLLGYREVLQGIFELTNFELNLTDDQLSGVRKQKNPAYPYGVFTPNNLEGLRDQHSKAMARNGMRAPKETATNATIARNYAFPAALGISNKILVRDVHWYLTALERLVVLGLTDGLTFEVNTGTFNFKVSVTIDPSLPINPTTLEQESGAGEFTIEFTSTLRTAICVTHHVPKINNEGRITRNVNINGEIV